MNDIDGMLLRMPGVLVVRCSECGKSVFGEISYKYDIPPVSICEKKI